jgi:hypothetical protein
VSIIPGKSTTNITPAVLAVAHPEWCTVSECRPTPDWDRDGTGFVAHHSRLLDADGLIVEVAQGETISPQGEVIEQDPIIVRVDAIPDELNAGQASRLAAALVRAAVGGGAR